MAVWLAALAERGLGSQPVPHIGGGMLEESGGAEEGEGWRNGSFGAITTGCMRPICTLNQMKNEITTLRYHHHLIGMQAASSYVTIWLKVKSRSCGQDRPIDRRNTRDTVIMVATKIEMAIASA